MEVESMPPRSQGRNYSNLEVMAHSNCLIVAAGLGGFILFAILLGVGIATNMVLSGFSLYVFLLSVAGLFVCICVGGWQYRLLKLGQAEREKQLKEQDQRIAIRARALKAFDEADKQGDNVKLRINDRELVFEAIRSTMNARQQSSRIVEEKQAAAALPGRVGAQQIAGPRSPYAVDPRLIAQRKMLEGIHVPTFGEALQRGLIVPGQEQILICYEIEVDEMTGEVTGRIKPYRDLLSNNCTMFLGGGSKSGKSTLMAALAAQEAMMNALFYIIDPHLSHPEKSIAKKLESLQHAFILPPAMLEKDIQRVLEHAEHEAYCRVNNIETPYTGRSIVFVVDESLALFGNAQRNPEDKELQKFYRRLALFMRDLGTAYNKFEMNGIFATQYLTKDAFKLPGGFSIDFRDACQNQTLLRLPPNQAQVMRLLQREELKEMRTLRQGFGFMGFATGDVIRMCSGNITKQDIESIAALVPPAPRIGSQFTGWGGPQPSKTVESDTYDVGVGAGGPRPQEATERAGVVPAGVYPMMNELQVAQFVRDYPQAKSVDACLDAIPGCNHRHRDHARVLVAQYGLMRVKKVQ
jgi:hypothetical protein